MVKHTVWRLILSLVVIRGWVSAFVFSSHRYGSSRNNAGNANHLMEVPSEFGTARKPDQTSEPTACQYIIHWKGEFNEGYSAPFRQIEFKAAIAATRGGLPPNGLNFLNALAYNNQDMPMVDTKVRLFNEAMQYIICEDELDEKDVIATVQRCSLVHACYRIVEVGNTYKELCEMAIENGAFADMCRDGENQNYSWCFRVRHYGGRVGKEKAKRHGHRSRSMNLEREALEIFEPLLRNLNGKVNLKEPDCKIYVFDGLVKQNKVLARKIASGAITSTIAPKTRICITNTPLCPIAAYSMCNVAQITETSNVLDPYAGSCTTLLAAAQIAPGSSSVAIEVAHDGLVNRANIIKDFTSRKLKCPLALLHGDCTVDETRDSARAKIAGQAFDAIIADPPYGVRESTGHNDLPPLTNLVQCIVNDRDNGKPLLKVGGRLVVFVPCLTGEATIDECLPTTPELQQAGLQVEVKQEQRLNDSLSRWLVSFVCIE